MRHREVAQARGSGRDRDGQVEGEETLAALGFAADDTDRLFGPQPGDKPALLGGPLGEPVVSNNSAEACDRLVA